jgi:integrase/recombinase XerD
MAKVELYSIEHEDQNDQKLQTLGVSLIAFLDTIRPRKDGSFTVRLRIIFKRVPKYYSTKINMSIEDYQKITEPGKHPRGELKDTKQLIKDKLHHAYIILEKMKVFTWAEFDRKFKQTSQDFSNVWGVFYGHIEKLRADDKHGTADSFKTALRSFQCYFMEEVKRKGKPSRLQLEDENFWKGKMCLGFDEIDPVWLENYNKWMTKQGKKSTTVSMNTRALRTVFNKGISLDEIPKEIYPFGDEKKGKYSPPDHNNPKRALSISDIEKLYKYESNYRNEIYYRDMFIFSYISYGLNPADILYLTNSDIDDRYINVIRKKTANRKNTFTIRILITEQHAEIIKKYSTGGKYIFPELNSCKTELEKQLRKKQFVHNMNDNLKRIASKIGIDSKISSMFARHSFGTIARNKGIPDSIVKACMGHIQSSKNVTSNYYADVTDDQLLEIHRILLPFLFDKELTDLEQLVFDKLPEAEQAIFLKLSSDEKQSFILKLLAEKLQ